MSKSQPLLGWFEHLTPLHFLLLLLLGFMCTLSPAVWSSDITNSLALQFRRLSTLGWQTFRGSLMLKSSPIVWIKWQTSYVCTAVVFKSYWSVFLNSRQTDNFSIIIWKWYKVSVNEAKLTGLWTRNCATTQQVLISEKFPPDPKS